MSDAKPQAEVAVIIPAGGRGHRMGGDTPKQYLPLNGRPVLWHSLRLFEANSSVGKVILVLHPDDEELCRHTVLRVGDFAKVRCVTPAGEQRHQSVLVGLKATGVEDRIVVVHDAVRPFSTDLLLDRVVAAARRHGAAIPVAPIGETVKQTRDDRVVVTLPRDDLRRAQTPQAFHRTLLMEAHEKWDSGRPPTDDAAMLEALGRVVRVVEGEEENIKITSPGDLEWAEWYARSRSSDLVTRSRVSVGQGVDVHSLVEGRELILGGVGVPFAKGLAGHSDADVLTHAIIDALLGAIGKGDIGRLFPDSDPQYKDISSLILLDRVMDLLDAERASVANVDAVVMAEQPKLAPHVDAISNQLAGVMRIDRSRISVKATTTERLGFVGREEGIMAQAVALVERPSAGFEPGRNA